MDPVLPTASPAVTDGFGQRMSGIDSESGDQVELLEFAPQIVEHTGFVTALAERVAKFASVRHASYVHMRRLDRPSADRLQLVSDLTPGWRISEMLEESAAAQMPIDITIVIGLLRQLLPAVALFSRHNRDAAIGVLSPHRLIVTPQARLAIAEYAFGPAMEKLNLGREKLWRDFRISMPPSTGLPRANPRADANAIGVVGLSLLLGRSLTPDEFPNELEALLESAQEHRDGQPAPLSGSFKNWLKRALQIDPDKAFQSPSEGQLAFESVLASDRSYVTSSPALTNWVADIGGKLDVKRRAAAPLPSAAPGPAVAAAPAPVTAAPPPPAPAAEEAAQEIEINLDELVVQSASALAQEKRQQEAESQQEAEPEEVEVPLDEPQVEAAVQQPEPAPAPAKVEEEDPIVAQLRTYQPKAAPPPVAPKVEEEDPIVAQLRTYQPKPEPPKPEPPKPEPPKPTDPDQAFKDSVVAQVRAQNARTRRCYELALREDPKLSGKLTVHFTVGTNGRSEKMTAEGLTPKLQNCVIERLRKLTFQKPPNPVAIAYPIVFEPDKPPTEEPPKPGEPPPPSELPKQPNTSKIVMTVRNMTPKFRECAAGKKGNASVQVDVAPDGSVKQVFVLGATLPPELKDCITNLVRAAKFDKSLEGARVVVPLSLQ